MLEVEPGRTSVTLSIRLAITLLVGSTATCRNCLSCSLAKLPSACPKTLLLSRSVRLPSVISAKFRGGAAPKRLRVHSIAGALPAPGPILAPWCPPAPACQFFGAVVNEVRRQRLLSEEHFNLDGTCWRRGSPA